MRAYQPDRVVKLLSGLTTALYYIAWGAAVLLLAWLPVDRVLAARHEPSYHITVPITVHPAVDVAGPWRSPGARVEVSEVRATASVPASSLSAGFLALAWITQAVLAALVLLFLHHLRRLFQRVRQGSPFDPGNAGRLRWLGGLLLGAAVWQGLTQFWLALGIEKLMEGPGNELGARPAVDGPAILVALVLLALAEIFRRGTALEDEQALVV